MRSTHVPSGEITVTHPSIRVPTQTAPSASTASVQLLAPGQANQQHVGVELVAQHERGHLDSWAGLELAGRRDPTAKDLASARQGPIHEVACRGQADAIGLVHTRDHPANRRAVGGGVTDSAELPLGPVGPAGVSEPEVAGTVENEIIGCEERRAVALGVHDVDCASSGIDPLNARRYPAVPGHAAVVAEIDRPVRPDGGTVGTAADLGHDRHLAAFIDTGQGVSGDLHYEHRPVGQRHRSLRERQPLGDHLHRFDLQRPHLPLTARLDLTDQPPGSSA
jgi:hypothetical protein